MSINKGKKKIANPIKSIPKKAKPNPKTNISTKEIMLSFEKRLPINTLPNEAFETFDSL